MNEERMRDLMKKRLAEAKKQEELEKQAELKKQAKLKEGRKVRREWYKKYEAQSKEAAALIWKWFAEFIKSPSFRDIAKNAKKMRSFQLLLSERIDCQVPQVWGGVFHGERQRLGLTLIKLDTPHAQVSKNKLVVHNCVKYGRSYQLNNVEDLLKYVYPPVLIEIAETIKDGKIWDIIEIV